MKFYQIQILHKENKGSYYIRKIKEVENKESLSIINFNKNNFAVISTKFINIELELETGYFVLSDSK